MVPAEAQALEDDSSVVTSVMIVRYLTADFFAGATGGVVTAGAGAVTAGAVVTAGVPTSVGVFVVFVFFVSVFL